MTTAYPCNSKICKMPDIIDSEKPRIGVNTGVKNSCCNRCSNLECPDYGVCECFETHFQIKEKDRDTIIKNLRKSLTNEED